MRCRANCESPRSVRSRIPKRAVCGCVVTTALLANACNMANDPALMGPPRPGEERWTILCTRIRDPDRVDLCNDLAAAIKQVPNLDSGRVRIEHDPDESRVLYGVYTRKPDARTGRLHFPPQFQKDIALIRHLALRDTFPFVGAEPIEIASSRAADANPEWLVRNNKADLTLCVAVFYNTGNFTERREAANQYVQLLREEGVEAYYLHELSRSYVFVGGFPPSAVTPTPDGPSYAPEVERLINSREEFKYTLDNGRRFFYIAPGGQRRVRRSFLVEVPREGSSDTWGQLPR